MKKARNTAVLLFGISNVGKTTTGRLLANQLNARFYDYCRDWIGMLAELLEDGGKHEDAQAVIAWDRKMSA